MLGPLDEPLRVPKLDLALWIVLAGVSVAAMVGTVRASKGLAKTFNAERKKIEAAEKSLEKFAKAESGAVRPNAAFKKEWETRRTALNKDLLDLWQQLYDRQATFLVWPKGEGLPVGPGPMKPKQELPPQACKSYNQTVVRREFERIFAKLQVRRPKLSRHDSTVKNLPFADEVADFDGLVAWDPKRRDAIVARRHLEKGDPSSVRVRLIQEDLWLFDSLVDAIQTLNRDVTDSLNAPLKQIDELEVAQWATQASLEQPAALWTPDDSKKAGPAPPATQATGKEVVSDQALLDGRYLDQHAQPLKGGEKQPFAEFKQVFVYMKLVIDQRRIPDLMAALANAPLPMETRQVVVQLVPDISVSEASVSEAPPGEGDDSAAAPAKSTSPPVIGSLATAETTPWDAAVAISGVVYLYSPPDPKKLGTGAAGSPNDRSFRVQARAAAAVPSAEY